MATSSGPNATRSAVGPAQYFQEQLEAGRFMIQRSRGSGAYVFYPRALAPGSGIDDLEWVEPSGLGVVYSTTMVLPGKTGGGGYNIALVELAEGPRLLTRVVDIAPDEVRIGMPVRAKIGQVEGKTVLLFAPAEAA